MPNLFDTAAANLRDAFAKLESELALATDPAASETVNLLEICIRQAAEKLRHQRGQEQQ